MCTIVTNRRKRRMYVVWTAKRCLAQTGASIFSYRWVKRCLWCGYTYDTSGWGLKGQREISFFFSFLLLSFISKAKKCGYMIDYSNGAYIWQLYWVWLLVLIMTIKTPRPSGYRTAHVSLNTSPLIAFFCEQSQVAFFLGIWTEAWHLFFGGFFFCVSTIHTSIDTW